MLRTDFQNLSLPLLGFGAMRLPTDANGSIDETALADMLRTAMDSGLNYFDTAYPYHSGMSEIVIITHKVEEQHIREALAKCEELDCVDSVVSMIRVID